MVQSALPASFSIWRHLCLSTASASSPLAASHFITRTRSAAALPSFRSFGIVSVASASPISASRLAGRPSRLLSAAGTAAAPPTSILTLLACPSARSRLASPTIRATVPPSARFSTSPPSPPPPPSKPPPAPLSEDIATLPNLLTIGRLLLTPYIGYLVCTSQFTPACIYLFLAGTSDLLDGWLARRTGRYTVFGSIADPAADKALMTTMVVSLAWSGMMPLALAALILGRDLALVASAFVIRYRTLQPPKTLARYFDPRLPSATVLPTAISKYNTFLQLLLVGVLTILPVVFPESQPDGDRRDGGGAEGGAAKEGWRPAVEVAIQVFMGVVAVTTVWSGLGYVGGAGSAKVLTQKVAQNVKGAAGKTKDKRV